MSDFKVSARRIPAGDEIILKTSETLDSRQSLSSNALVGEAFWNDKWENNQE